MHYKNDPPPQLKVGQMVRPRSNSYPLFLPIGYSHLYSYGPGHAVPYPKVLSVPENRGACWKVTNIWQTGWVALQNIRTGQNVFSVPPHSVVPAEESFENVS